MKWILERKPEGSRKAPIRTSRHPLPWRNDPSGGENHVADANGLPVYDGSDAAEMFRLYRDESRAERTTAEHLRAARRRPSRRPRRAT
jgi:hypothetical protein